MASNILVFIFVLLIQNPARSLNKDTKNTCFKNLKREYACCANYEERNDACFACTFGFYSRMGQTCIPCETNWYGHFCQLQCKCNSLQRCDNIHGCVSRKTTSLSTEHHSAGISMRDLLIYSGSITGFIVVLGLCHCYNKHRRKMVINSTPAVINGDLPAENSSNETFEMSESLYHVIDENNMENPVQYENPFKEVVNELEIADE